MAVAETAVPTVAGRAAGPPRRNGRDLPGWDGLRALAATGVLVLHATFERLRWGGAPLAVVAQFQAGVQVFFVISAFLLSRPYLRSLLDRSPAPAPWSYARRRVLRIYPAYWFALVVAVLIGQHSFHGAKEWLAQLGLLQVYAMGPFTRSLGVAWTLSVEVSFYLFLPLFFLAVRRAGRRFGARRSLGAGLVLLFAAGMAFATWAQVTKHFLATFWIPFHLPVFAAGMAIAWVAVESEHHRGLRAAADRVGRLALLWWALAGSVLLLAAAHLGSTVVLARSRAATAQVYWGLAAVLIALPVALGFRRRGVGRLLELRPVRFLGLVSYGIYLWHPQLVRLISHDWLGWETDAGNPWSLAVAVLAASATVGAVSWYVVERPALRLGHRS